MDGLPSQDKRVKFDFEVEFANGGGLQGRDFRLDIVGEAISDEALADYLVRDLRLLMVASVRISNKEIITERHKRNALGSHQPKDSPKRRLVDLSHTVVSGMITYKGLPAPIVCDYLTREASREHYAEGTEFHIGRIDMVANTGTYVDSPFHRFADGKDLSELELGSVADLPGVVVRVTGTAGRAIDRDAFKDIEVSGRAVLVHTGWSKHWGTDAYFEGHPFLTEAAALYLKENEAALVGIDSLNIDDIRGGQRPVHTVLLGAGIPVAEHLRGLEQLPLSGFRFSAAPVKVKGMGTFPVRAYAVIEAGEN